MHGAWNDQVGLSYAHDMCMQKMERDNRVQNEGRVQNGVQVCKEQQR